MRPPRPNRTPSPPLLCSHWTANGPASRACPTVDSRTGELGGSWVAAQFELGLGRDTSVRYRIEKGGTHNMKIGRSGFLRRSYATKRLIGRAAIVGLLSAGPVFLLQENALASGPGGLSSTILAVSVPGLVQTPLGTENGPITQSNIGLVLGSNVGASSALGQSLGNGSVSAYIRSWNHQPSDGDAAVITAYQFKYASDETSFVDGLDSELRSQAGQAGNESFAVTGIPRASSAETHTSVSGGPLTEYVEAFAKGNTAFQVVIATSSGDLTSADAVSVANQQFAIAPDIPASGSGTNWHLLRVVPLVGLVLCIAIVVIGRKRKYPPALRGLPPRGGQNWGPPRVAPSGTWGTYSSPVGSVPSEQQPKVSVDQWQ